MENAIAITDLADHNNGVLRFKWIDVELINDIDDLQELITKFLGDHEEWFISDYDNFPNLGEYPDLDDVMDIINILNDYDMEVIKAYRDIGFGDMDLLEDHYVGTYDSEEEYAWEFVESCGGYNDIPEHLQYYFDIDSYTKDLFINDFHSAKTINHKVIVFRSC